jgi:hypothetical protein
MIRCCVKLGLIRNSFLRVDELCFALPMSTSKRTRREPHTWTDGVLVLRLLFRLVRSRQIVARDETT